MAPSYPDHGGLSSGEDALMAVTAEVAKGPSPWLDWGYEGVERVAQCKVQLCVQTIAQRLASGGATRR